MIMDIGRIGYDMPCQFFTGGGPPLKIRWYRAATGAEFFPEPHIFTSSIWSAEPWELQGPGEIWGQSPHWTPGRTPPTSKGQSYFGPLAYFQGGQPYDPSAPPVVRDAFGLAAACSGGIPQVVEVSAGVAISTESD